MTRYQDGRTALILAALGDHLPVCQSLIERGAEMDIQDNVSYIDNIK